ncbi:ATP-binding cassette domain-containing protein [Tumebacillus flagellatus]|uniref:Bacitracin ABC transporter ATP-binding protein n=1 Tax=Tumebacillus flagellatus TaxID=1157490 RepID=A0A074LJW9_9BACL|nr:ATP-binding cassette domain-containing protein [Tumebacillus flagellatus]KEO82461.1 bacitracin ABC transporter ATP-binding protein [Tumebacillus flagellatus]
MSEMVIQTQQLTRRYGRQVSVADVNLQVPQGSIYGFLGPNGAGKTTTIRMLLGLIRPTSGRVRLFNQDLEKNRISVLRRVGSLVESPSYYGHLTGTENLKVIARLLGVCDQHVAEVLDLVRLTQAANKQVKGYSLGMKQRLGIAAALLGSPDLLILDEPTNGLDPAGIQEIRELILEMPKQHGITVLVSSHLLSEIEQMATQVGIINEGKMIFQGPMDDLRRQSRPQLVLETERPQDVRNFLQDQGWSVTLEDGLLSLPNADFETSAGVNRELVMAGFSVYRMREVKPSLEDIFLDLVGKGVSL